MRFYLTLSFLILLFSCSDNNQKMILNQDVGYVQGTTFNIKYLRIVNLEHQKKIMKQL